MIIIAELVNATRKKVREAVLGRDAAHIKKLVADQKKAGGTFIDINVGTGKGDTKDEIASMQWAVAQAIEVGGADIALSIDSANNEVLQAGLEACPKGVTHFINSVTAESNRIEVTLKLVKKYNTNVVALAMGDEGIKVEPEARLAAAVRIRDMAKSMGIADDRLYFDPLVMPLGTDPRNPTLTLDTGRAIKAKYPAAHLCMGLSNVSHGLPERRLINRVFLTLAMQAGFDGAIIDPCDADMMSTLVAADALLGRDEFCMNYIAYIRARQQAKQA
ncbi:MAG: dihydropteroate synthase [Planctomycetota bacterium]